MERVKMESVKGGRVKCGVGWYRGPGDRSRGYQNSVDQSVGDQSAGDCLSTTDSLREPNFSTEKSTSSKHR